MGLARTHGHTNNLTQRLGVLASEFSPAHAPYWVSQPDARHPSQGWWWIPEGASAPCYLGYNHVVVESDLRRLSDAHYKTPG